MKKNLNNKREQGIARILIYPEKKKYIGVCLDFDIIEETESKEGAINQIKEATRGYIINVWKNKLDDSLLNRPAPEKYWKIYEEYSRFITAKNEEGVRKITPEIKSSSLFSLPISDFMGSRDLCMNNY
ncbi:MAG: hypothetical protein PHU56_00100 [Candidatus Pacebacteria bacterium]|nr:hypothetical protein [Candidatus Paceibacterota bacterium]